MYNNRMDGLRYAARMVVLALHYTGIALTRNPRCTSSNVYGSEQVGTGQTRAGRVANGLPKSTHTLSLSHTHTHIYTVHEVVRMVTSDVTVLHGDSSAVRVVAKATTRVFADNPRSRMQPNRLRMVLQLHVRVRSSDRVAVFMKSLSPRLQDRVVPVRSLWVVPLMHSRPRTIHHYMYPTIQIPGLLPFQSMQLDLETAEGVPGEREFPVRCCGAGFGRELKAAMAASGRCVANCVSTISCCLPTERTSARVRCWASFSCNFLLTSKSVIWATR